MLKPHNIESKAARIELITEANPFIPHISGIRDGCCFFILSIIIGKGKPIKNACGAMRSKVIRTFDNILAERSILFR